MLITLLLLLKALTNSTSHILEFNKKPGIVQYRKVNSTKKLSKMSNLFSKIWKKSVLRLSFWEQRKWERLPSLNTLW